MYIHLAVTKLREWRQLVDWGLKHRLVVSGPVASFAVAGAAMALSHDVLDQMRRLAFYVDKVLRGAVPSDLPIEQPTKFSFVINLKTAKALGLTIPPSLLARANGEGFRSGVHSRRRATRLYELTPSGRPVDGCKTCGASNRGGTMRVQGARAIRDIIDGARAAFERSKRVADGARETLAIRHGYARSAAARSERHQRDLAARSDRRRTI